MFSAAASGVGAAPNISETVQYYPVSGATLDELREELRRGGPNGFWGFTSWRIKWTVDCEVDLQIYITMPQLDLSSALPDHDRRRWRMMIEALYRHEQLHAEHGRQAASEIVETRCTVPHEVIRKWADRDRILDRDTKHGRTQGVTLRD